MGKDLAFVVRRAPAVQDAVADRRLERRRLPFRQRILGLHVVVPVDQHATGLLALGRRTHDGLASDVDKLRLEAQLAEVLHQPLGARAGVLIARPLRADGGKPHELLEFFDEARLVRVNVRFGSICHGTESFLLSVSSVVL